MNVAGYRFVALPDAAALREPLHREAAGRGLRGTILLAAEGINLFLAGAPAPLRDWLAHLRADPRFAELPVRESWSDALPFGRLKVKVKREIIRMDHPTIRPAEGRAPALDPATLRRWLDQGHDDAGRPLALLDTRNAFEVDLGSFDGAIDWRLARFGDFPAALERHREALAGRTIVSFCTGGIRCEKAALLLAESGVQDAWQLDGGILRWLAEQGSAHFHGRCFVFDERQPLGADLQEAP